MFNVCYYQNTKEFYEQTPLDNDAIHLTQSASFAEYLRNKNPETNVFGYKTFFDKMFPEWNNPLTEIYLRSVVREYIYNHFEEKEALYYSKRVNDFYLSLRFLVEFGGLPLHIFPDSNQDQKLLVSMYKELSKHSIITSYLLDRVTMNKEKIKERLELSKQVKAIYLHHFDYIDGVRMMLFNHLKNMGYEVIFYIPFSEGKMDLYKNWISIYEQITNYSSNDWECMNYFNNDLGNRFAHYIDKDVPALDKDRYDVEFLTFNHPTEFKDFLMEKPLKKKQHEVVTMFEENLNIYTDHTEKSHFYATSYGKFFLSLQNCKKTDQEILFSYDDYVNMLVSGWVQAGSSNGSKALTLLIDLRVYMEGVSTFQDVLDRLQSLLHLQDFSQAFDEVGKEQADRHRLKRYLSNPWRAFPYVHHSRYEITVRQLIECTKDLARKVNRLLLSDQEKRNVHSYINELQRMYSGVKEQLEPKFAMKFEALLYTEIPLTWEFGKEELFQLLTLYLAAEDDENINKIKNFDQLIGLTLTTRNIHVTGLSLKTFPWKTPSLPNLLTHTWLKKCVYQSFISVNRESRLQALLVDYYSRKVSRNTAIYSLYHLLAYADGNIAFSYINELEENDGPSIYYSILEELYSKEQDDNFGSEKNDLLWDDDPAQREEELPMSALESIPDILWLDSDFCYKKFYINAFIERHPIYEKDFHQQPIYASITKLLSEQGEGEQGIQEVVFPLFPQWTNAKKQNLLDTAFSKGLRKYKSYENIYYPKAMKRLQILYSRYEVTKNWKVKHRFDNDTFQVEDHAKEFVNYNMGKKMKANAGNHCRMCPYLHVCEEGEYAIDASDY